MKPYGYKKLRKPPGDGCFLCTQCRKETKSAKRAKVKSSLKEFGKKTAALFFKEKGIEL
jgi:hypothetical protein